MRYILFLLLFLLFEFTYAQIVINRNDFGKIGDKVLIAVDTPVISAVSIMSLSTGANKTWNFKNILQPNLFDSFVYTLPEITAPAQATIKVSSFKDSHYEKLDSQGMNIILDRPANNINGLTLKILSFPFTYNSKYLDSIVFHKLGTPVDFNTPLLATIGYDSVRAEISAYDTSECVGWGVLQLPDTTCNVVQVKIVTESFTNLYAHSNFTGWVNINSMANVIPRQRIVEFQWFAKNAKGYLARASLDSTGSYVRSFMYRVPKIEIPALFSLSPNKAKRGESLDLLLRARYTHFTQGTNLSFTLKLGSAKIFVNNVTVINDTCLIANITVSTNNVLGKYDLTVNDPIAGSLSLPASFTVYATANLQSVMPASLPRGGSGTLLVKGTNTFFSTDTPSLQVKFIYQSLVSNQLKVLNVLALNDSMLSIAVRLDSLVPKGKYSISVTNSFTGELFLVDSFEVSMANAIRELKLGRTFKMYPNPCDNFLQVNLDPKSQVQEYTIYNSKGIPVKICKIAGSIKEITINTSELPEGNYYLQLVDGENYPVQKFEIIRK